MATRLEGDDTFFLPFNKGTKTVVRGNDVPEDINQYATDYYGMRYCYPPTC